MQIYSHSAQSSFSQFIVRRYKREMNNSKGQGLPVALSEVFDWSLSWMHEAVHPPVSSRRNLSTTVRLPCQVATINSAFQADDLIYNPVLWRVCCWPLSLYLFSFNPLTLRIISWRWSLPDVRKSRDHHYCWPLSAFSCSLVCRAASLPCHHLVSRIRAIRI